MDIEENKPEESKMALETSKKDTSVKFKIPKCDLILEKYNKNFSFNLFTLNDSYDHVYQHYMYSTCDYCGNRPNKSDFALCLLSGTVICMRQCQDDTLSSSKLLFY